MSQNFGKINFYMKFLVSGSLDSSFKFLNKFKIDKKSKFNVNFQLHIYYEIVIQANSIFPIYDEISSKLVSKNQF